jgi:hypothetical protein
MGDAIVAIALRRLFCLNGDSWFDEGMEGKLSQMFRTASIAAMMLILSSGLDIRGFAQANAPQGVKNIVLVHGAWASSRCRTDQ